MWGPEVRRCRLWVTCTIYRRRRELGGFTPHLYGTIELQKKPEAFDLF
jgi:hypothetical protein